MTWQILQGDCVEQMRDLDDSSVDAVVTDPPYGIGFMGREWDVFSPAAIAARELQRDRKGTERTSAAYPDKIGGTQGGGPAIQCDESLSGNQRFQAWCQAWAIEAFRVLKPGGHLLASCGTRTYHRLASGIEDAGFEIRDSIMWLYGSGFPKSLDVSKAIDKAADYRLQATVRRAAVAAVEAAGLTLPGNSRHDWTVGEHAPGEKWWATFRRWLPTLSDEEREKVERETVATVQKTAGWFTSRDLYEVTSAATPEAAQWDGWGTALKPAHEPIVVARRPLIGTVAENVLTYGVGSINVDGCRIRSSEDRQSGESRGGETDPRGDGDGGVLGLRQDDPQVEVEHGQGEMAADLRPQVSGRPDEGSNQPALQGAVGREADRVSVRPTGPARRGDEGVDPAGEAGDSRASGGNGKDDRALADESGARPPHQRGQAGQPAGKSDPHGLGGALAGAPGSASSDDCPRSGEPSPAGRDGEPSAGRRYAGRGATDLAATPGPRGGDPAGRWPANVVLSHTEDCTRIGTTIVKGDQRETGNGRRSGGFADVGAEPGDAEPNGPVYGDEEFAVWECAPGCPVAELDRQSGRLQSGRRAAGVRSGMGYHGANGDGGPAIEGDAGGASRFFYCAKTSRAERNAGLEGFAEKSPWTSFDGQFAEGRDPKSGERTGEYKREQANHHPTVKPINLMRWLVRLVTPPGGVILDPFVGSGSTGCAAVLEGFDFTGIEREPEYIAIAGARIAFWSQHVGREVEDVLGLHSRSTKERGRHDDAGQLSLEAA
jgi:DNA modification methylase